VNFLIAPSHRFVSLLHPQIGQSVARSDCMSSPLLPVDTYLHDSDSSIQGTQRERVLLVEDDADSQQMLALTLGHMGYQVQTATNGHDALQKWRNAGPGRRPELVLTSLRMPDFDGLELLREVRADEPNLPVIVMTAFNSDVVLVNALRLHADEFIGKPVALDELADALNRALCARRERVACEVARTRATRLQASLEMAAAVNHAINNPLATISASAQLLRRILDGATPIGTQTDCDGCRPTRRDTQNNDQPESNPGMALANVECKSLAVTTAPVLDTAALHHLLNVIVEQCERIADFNRKLSRVVNPVTRTSGGQIMLDVDHSH
jgi:CheY-like chemotaxis protein